MEIKESIRQFYEEVVTRNELARVGEFVSPDCVVRMGNDTVPLGVDGMKAHIAATKATYPGYAMQILRQYQDGDTVVSEFIMTGAHRGEYLGITPTGKMLSITGVNIDQVIDGKIAVHGGAANTFEAFWANGLIEPV